MADTAATDEQPDAQDGATLARRETRRVWLFRLAMVVALGLALWGGWYLLVGRNHVGTDNAYVNAEVAQVTPLLSARLCCKNREA